MGQNLASSTRSSSKSKASLFIFLSIFVVPPILLRLRILPFSWRYYVLGAMIILVTVYYAFRLYILPKRKFKLKRFMLILRTLGLRTDNLIPAFKANFIFSATAVAAMFCLYGVGLSPKRALPDNLLLFVIFYIGSALVQEFWFRCVFYAEFKYRKISDFWFVVISSLNFAYLHIFFKDTPTMIVTLIGGVAWGIIYAKYPNFWTIALSHLILGVAALLFGFIGNVG